jgi:prolipoprotein diacylglyceryltransferase/protein-S-isoprenylcysteine O-methyltransferase Ste14
VKEPARTVIAKFMYGALFVVLLPWGLAHWASRLDNSIVLPAPMWAPGAVIGVALGCLITGMGMLELLFRGKGLPMNAFPPKRLVTAGIYAWLSHPIYFGVALLASGSSFWFRSASGLYVITPVLILAMVSLVYGYERTGLLKTHGDLARRYRPRISVPSHPGIYRRLAITAILFVSVASYLSAVLFLLRFHFGKNVLATVLGAAAILFASFEHSLIWNALKRISEWVANSRNDWLFFGGAFRIVNHSIFSCLAGATTAGFLAYVIGNDLAVLLLGSCAISGAAGFAQFRWGSSSLLRPFGYWGAIMGGSLGIVLIWIIFRIPLLQTAVAGALCAPFAQAIGRLRCLSQGCCHGTVTSSTLGIRVWQNQSRVVVLSGLKGEFIMPTQLFSILFNLALGLLLLSVWSSQRFNDSFVVGLYLILTGIERFTEDAYRGEKQTRQAMGLKENQFIAIVAVLAGTIVSILPSTAAGPAREFSITSLATVLLGGLLTAFALSMDFPHSHSRFSRLSG